MEITRKEYCIDSDVLIDFMRGLKVAHDFLVYESAHGRLSISVVSCVELWAGSATKKGGGSNVLQEVDRLERFLDGFDLIAVDKSMARRAGELRREYHTPFADAIIAASALEYGLGLVTRNIRHFEKISKSEGLMLVKPY